MPLCFLNVDQPLKDVLVSDKPLHFVRITMQIFNLRAWIAVVFIVGLTSQDGYTATQPVPVQVRDADGNNTATITLTLIANPPVNANQCVYYANNAEGGVKTRHGNRTFAQYWFNLSFPVNAVDINGNPYVITADKVNAYWDTYYGPNYTRIGNPNLNYNCWEYALPPNNVNTQVWVNDPGFIYTDDFKTTTALQAKNRIRVQRGVADTHVIVILEIQNDGGTGGGTNYIKMTQEKNRQSAVYQKIYKLTDKKTANNMYERVGKWDNF